MDRRLIVPPTSVTRPSTPFRIRFAPALVVALAVGAALQACASSASSSTRSSPRTLERISASTTTVTEPSSTLPSFVVTPGGARRFTHVCPYGNVIEQADNSRLANERVFTDDDDYLCPPPSSSLPTISEGTARAAVSNQPFYSAAMSQDQPEIVYALWTNPNAVHSGNAVQQEQVDVPVWAFMFLHLSQPLIPCTGCGGGKGPTTNPSSTTTASVPTAAQPDAVGTALYLISANTGAPMGLSTGALSDYQAQR